MMHVMPQQTYFKDKTNSCQLSTHNDHISYKKLFLYSIKGFVMSQKESFCLILSKSSFTSQYDLKSS